MSYVFNKIFHVLLLYLIIEFSHGVLLLLTKKSCLFTLKRRILWVKVICLALGLLVLCSVGLFAGGKRFWFD